MDNLPDKDAIKKIKHGEINFFEVIVERYSRKFLNYVKTKVKSPDDSKDIIQNSFIKLYKGLDRFNEDKPLSPYFYSIVNSEIAQFFRDNPKNVVLDETIPSELIAHEDDTSDPSAILENLKGESKVALELLAEGFSYQEIAQKLNKKLNTVKTIIRRAKLEVQKNVQR